MSVVDEPNLEACLARFGLESFRPGQSQVIASLLKEHDCLCIMPTGGGKSLCYQLPAVAREGLTLVVSPLIALMKDQVDALETLGIGATCINSSMGLGEQQDRIERMVAGEYDLVYVAPERLRNHRFFESLRPLKLQLLAIDEAHCVSEWGHDFRPDYARLGEFRERLGFPQTIALTATATPLVREDIVKLLRLREPQTVITGFGRENLEFAVWPANSSREKDEQLRIFLASNPGSGIIYASTRKRCSEVADVVGEILARENPPRRVGVYHAGLETEARGKAQEAFMDGDLDVIVATNAFGMGIDKADLRFVVHYNMPGSLEAYYQEAGRAGRDGDHSRCLLQFQMSDRYLQEFFIENAYPSPHTVARVYDYLRSLDEDPIELTLEELKERLDLEIGNEGVGACEQLLEKAGVLERLSSQDNQAAVRFDSELHSFVELLPRDARVQRRVLRQLEKIVGSRRRERVYFSLANLQAACNLTRESVNRAMRALLHLPGFDYVPPFRGRAVHMLRRDQSFAELNIDFAELRRRKAAELEKLDRVIRFARSKSCRQLEILDYFGDPNRKTCGTCDNCGQGAVPLVVTNDLTVDSQEQGIHKAIRIILSGVARCKGRVGKQLVAQMLCGSKATKVKKLNLHRLSTFGLLAPLRQTEVAQLIDQLLAVGLLQQSDVDRFRPVLQLTDLGGEVMTGDSSWQHPLRLPEELIRKLALPAGVRKRSDPRPAASLSSASALSSANSSAQDAAATTRNTPAPGPASSRTENASAGIDQETSPKPPQALAHQAFASTAGDGLELEQDVDRPAARVQPEESETSDVQPAYYWTWQLIQRGFRPEDCCPIRRLTMETIWDHLNTACQRGLPIGLDAVFSDDELDMLRSGVTGEHAVGRQAVELFERLVQQDAGGQQERPSASAETSANG